MKKPEQPKKGTPLLDRYIQRTTMDKMQKVDDEALAQAIKTLLLKDKDNPKNLN